MTRVRVSARVKPVHEAREEPRALGPRGRAGIALLAFTVAAVLLTLPVAVNLTAAPMGDGADAHIFLWNHWWFRTALLGGENPYATDAIYWPTGTDLYLHTLSPLNAAASMILEPVVGLTGAYNVLMLASFALTAWGAYLLARRLTGSEAGAYVAGFAFGFTPYHYAHALGHLNLVSYYWLPFFALFFHRFVHAPDRRGLVGASLMLVGAGLTDLSHLLVMGLFAGAYAALTLGWRNVDWLKRTLLPTAAAGIILSPWILMVLVGYWRTPGLGGFGNEAPRYSVDALAYAWPTELSTLYAGIGRVLTPGGTATEATVFLSFTVLVLAGVAIARVRGAEVRAWALVAAAFYVLSLGPVLHVAGFRTGIPLPYVIFGEIPLLNTIRSPARFALGVILSASVLAAFGVQHALERWRKRYRLTPARARQGMPGIAAAVVVILLAEVVVLPFPAVPFDVHPAYSEAALGDADALVNLPLHQPGYAGYLQNVHYMGAQTVHGLPIVNGYTSRETVRDTQFLQGELVLGALTRLEKGGLRPDHVDVFPEQDTRAVAGDLLSAQGLTTLLFHRGDAWRHVEAREIAFLRSLDGVEQVDVVDDVIVFRATPTGNAPPVLMDLRGGWHGLELWEGETPFRWAFRAPELTLTAREAGRVNLAFEAMPFLYYPLDARRVDVILNGETVDTVEIPGGWSNVTLDLDLREGRNLLVLKSREPAASPLRLGAGDDPRPFGFAVRNVTVRSNA